MLKRNRHHNLLVFVKVVREINQDIEMTCLMLIIIISYFEQFVSRIYPTALQLNKANFFDNEAPFFGLGLVHNE